jgi:ABC-type sugar transport system permease subunit
MKKSILIFTLGYTFIIDVLLLRYGVILGTLADENIAFRANFDTVFLLITFLTTCALQIYICASCLVREKTIV